MVYLYKGGEVWSHNLWFPAIGVSKLNGYGIAIGSWIKRTSRKHRAAVFNILTHNV